LFHEVHELFQLVDLYHDGARLEILSGAAPGLSLNGVASEGSGKTTGCKVTGKAYNFARSSIFILKPAKISYCVSHA
jgi:hypothetical protein